MKRSLWAALIFAAAALIAFLSAYKEVNKGKEDILVTEEILWGDPGEAEGITLWSAVHWKGNLLWDTEYVIGGKGAKSSFTFSSIGAAKEFGWRAQDTEYISGYFAIGGFGTATAMTGNTAYSAPVDLGLFPMQEISSAVAERTGAGEERTETVRLCDYFEYYPVVMEVHYNAGKNVNYSGGQDIFTELFQIPVEEDAEVEMTVGKNEKGEVDNIQCKSATGRTGMASVYAFGENGCYYAYSYENWNTGETLDRGQNSGIFYLPYVSMGDKYRDSWTIDTEQVKKVCELPRDAALAQMMLKEDEGRLYLVVKGQEGYSLLAYKLDGATPVLEQQILVCSAEEYPYWSQMDIEESGILMVWQDNSFVYLAQEDGQYRIWCRGIFPKTETEKDPFMWERACFFDGQRLALAAFDGIDGIDIRLAVYGEEGLRYSGIYRNSLSEEPAYGSAVVPQGAQIGALRQSGINFKPLGLNGIACYCSLRDQ